MKIITPSFQIITPIDPAFLRYIEFSGRTCYKSELSITEKSTRKFIVDLIKNGHESVLEHQSITVKVICDRGVSHEIVRHRIASFSQESTRFCNYGKNGEVVFIKPCFWREGSEEYFLWISLCRQAEKTYLYLVNDLHCKPQEARSVLPNSLKTEIVITMNLREWRHFFKLRAAGITGKPHPQMLEITVPMLKTFKEKIPAVFDDIEPTGNN